MVQSSWAENVSCLYHNKYRDILHKYINILHVQFSQANQSGKSGTIRESNQASGVRMAHYVKYYVWKSSIL